MTTISIKIPPKALDDPREADKLIEDVVNKLNGDPLDLAELVALPVELSLDLQRVPGVGYLEDIQA